MLQLLLAYWTHVVLCILVYVCCLSLYRIYLSPLSRFPGPKLAAASFFYEGYYNLVRDGQYPWRIREMHQQYGPVVRVNPREVHIHDPDFVDELYLQRLDKDPWFARSFAVPLSSVGTVDQELHRQRRGAVNKFFSKTSIASRAGIIQDRVFKLCSKLAASVETGEIVQLDAGFICLTLDVIAEFCYGVDYRFLDIPGFDTNMKKMMESLFGAGAFLRLFPFVMTLTQALPVWLVRRLTPGVAGILHLQEMVRAEAKRMISSRGPEKISPNQKVTDSDKYNDIESAGISYQTTIFDQILSSKLPMVEKSQERLVQEGQTLISAGTETTGRVLYLSTVHLLEQSSILSRLRQELQQVMPTPTAQPTLQQLEQLPFLTAVIKESIRLGGSLATRATRMSTAANPIQYKDHTFPPGTPVGMTLFHILMDGDLFPEPTKFDPMRWLTTEKNGQQLLRMSTELDKYFVAFSRGPRSCAGMWLAWAECYLTIAHVHRKFDMELYETSVADVEAACDRFTCFAKPGNQGVRVKIVRMREE